MPQFEQGSALQSSDTRLGFGSRLLPPPLQPPPIRTFPSPYIKQAFRVVDLNVVRRSLQRGVELQAAGLPALQGRSIQQFPALGGQAGVVLSSGCSGWICAGVLLPDAALLSVMARCDCCSRQCCSLRGRLSSTQLCPPARLSASCRRLLHLSASPSQPTLPPPTGEDDKGRIIALKVYPTGSEGTSEFQHEQSVHKHDEHRVMPGIIAVCPGTGDQASVLLMEYIEGVTLEEAMKCVCVLWQGWDSWESFKSAVPTATRLIRQLPTHHVLPHPLLPLFMLLRAPMAETPLLLLSPLPSALPPPTRAGCLWMASLCCQKRS